jgi:hypothetical protein
LEVVLLKTLKVGALIALITSALVIGVSGTALAFPERTGACTGCHDGVAVPVSTTLLSTVGTSATYSVSAPGADAIAVFDGATKVATIIGATGGFSVSLGKTYTIYAVTGPGTSDGLGQTTVTLAAASTTSVVEHDAAGVVFDRWVTGFSAAYSGGGYVYSRWTGTKLDASFTGSKISWFGPKQPSYGMADVYIDGALVASNVDSHADAPGVLSTSVWESGGLSDGPHTISIRLTGAKNPVSTGNTVVVDRFDVTGGAPAGGGARIDDSLAMPGYTGSWVAAINPTYVDSTYRYSRWATAAFSATFTGTRVAWIGPRTPNYGVAEIWVDDVKVATVDCYRATLATQGWREVVWQSDVLTPGEHALKIVPTGTMNAVATAANVVIDAIDVTP